MVRAGTAGHVLSVIVKDLEMKHLVPIGVGTWLRWVTRTVGKQTRNGITYSKRRLRNVIEHTFNMYSLISRRWTDYVLVTTRKPCLHKMEVFWVLCWSMLNGSLCPNFGQNAELLKRTCPSEWPYLIAFSGCSLWSGSRYCG